jgi:integration host factor subunit alpha
MTINKANLINSIHNNSDFEKQEATSAIESLLEIIKKTLESGEDVLISRFGKFIVKEKNKRRGRNPETGDDLILDARRIVTFKCSKNLGEKLNVKKKKRKKL